MSEQTENTEQQQQDVLSRITSWYKKNEKVISYSVFGVVAVIAAYWAYQKFIVAPQQQEASNELYIIEKAFKEDSLDIILKGKDGGLSAIDIADEYGSTKAGNLAKFYAGYAFFKKGDYETAREYFESFNAQGDPLVGPNKVGLIGDCYAAQKEYKKAASYYEKAGKKNINDLTTPHWMFKAGAAYEKVEDFKNAVSAYEYIQDNCPKVAGKSQVEKYLNYARSRMGEFTEK